MQQEEQAGQPQPALSLLGIPGDGEVSAMPTSSSSPRFADDLEPKPGEPAIILRVRIPERYGGGFLSLKCGLNDTLQLVSVRVTNRLKSKRFVGAHDSEDNEVFMAAGGEKDLVDFTRSSFFFREASSPLVLPDNESLQELFAGKTKVELIVNIEKIREIRLSGKQLETLKTLITEAEAAYSSAYPKKKSTKPVTVAAAVKNGNLNMVPHAIADQFFIRAKQLASNSNALWCETLPNGVEGIGAILAILIEARTIYIQYFNFGKDGPSSVKQLAWLLPIVERLDEMVSDLLYAAAQTFNKEKECSEKLSAEVEAIMLMLEERLDPDRSVAAWGTKEVHKLFELSLEFRQLRRDIMTIRKQGFTNDALLFLLVSHFTQQVLMKLHQTEHKELRQKFFSLLYMVSNTARAGYWAVLRSNSGINLRESVKWDMRDCIFDIPAKLLWGKSNSQASPEKKAELFDGPPPLLSDMIRQTSNEAPATQPLARAKQNNLAIA